MPTAPKSPDGCPFDINETAEDYVMGWLSPGNALQFEVHCTRCRRCAAAAEDAEQLVTAMKAAAQELMAEPSTSDWRWCPGPLPSINPKPLVGVSAQMRFFVTGYAPPRAGR
jgi:hypothetical protein